MNFVSFDFLFTSCIFIGNLEKLASVGLGLSISENSNLVSLTGLENLVVVAPSGYSSSIYSNPAFDCSPYNVEPYPLTFFPLDFSNGNLVDCVTE